ncbi:acyltransferase [Alteromonas sp. KUL42]|uniref:acyltransferase family protein n=1 Tax=Alteromonas sp. KUL42 TaxID=2480797 RepID=UPI001035C418|nr:acyltransferase [Alteromonas sp. KUL42]TAP38419.1 acyltransferase [Alteromonas sp. KUL42]
MDSFDGRKNMMRLSEKSFLVSLKEKLELDHGGHSPLLSMEGLRGIAVFLVFLVHYSTLIEPWVAGGATFLSSLIHGLGNIGVDLFFVLSGYLIYGTIINKEKFNAFTYARRRLQRIYPTFLVVLIVYLIASFLFPSESKLPNDFGPMLIYIIQNALLLPGLFDIKPIITVAWSLSYEVFYYITIPVLVSLLRLKTWRVNQRIFLWIAVTVFGAFLWKYTGGPIRLLMFVSGILLFELHKNKQLLLQRGGTRLFFLALGIVGLQTIYEFSFLFMLMSVYVLFLAMCLCAFNPKSTMFNWLTISSLRWLGNMSYSYYLLHGITLKCAFLVLGMLLPIHFSSNSIYYWLWIPMFIATLFTSFTLYILIERPLSLDAKNK